MTVLWIILGIIGALVLFVLYLLFSKTKIFIAYKDDVLYIRARNGLLHKTYRPKKKTQTPKQKPKDLSKDGIKKEVKKTESSLLDEAGVLWRFLKGLRFNLEVVKTKLKIEFGTGNPADTGIIYGVIWAAIGNVYHIINSYVAFEFPETDIKPDFENQVFKIEFEGIIKLKIVHIISALLNSVDLEQVKTQNIKKDKGSDLNG